MATAHRDHQPAEGFFDRDGQRRRLQPVRKGNVRMERPTQLGSAEAFEAVGEVGVLVGHDVRPAGPHDDGPVGPRRLQAHLTGGIGRRDQHLGARAGRAQQQVVGRLEPVEVGFEVTDHLGALRTLDAADRVEAVLGLVHQPLEDQAPCGGIGFEQQPLVSGGDALSCCPRRGFECTGVIWHAGGRRCSPGLPSG